MTTTRAPGSAGVSSPPVTVVVRVKPGASASGSAAGTTDRTVLPSSSR